MQNIQIKPGINPARNGFSPYEFSKLQAAVIGASRIWLTAEFENSMKNHTKRNGALGFENTIEDGAEIVRKLRSQVYSVNFFIYTPPWYKRWSSVVAYEDSQGIHFSRSKFVNQDCPSLINTVAHECTHAVGYTHDFNATARRPDSVPYVVGQICETIARRIQLTYMNVGTDGSVPFPPWEFR